ncbi:MAG: hypothetical protein JJU06_03705 [Ectothiorhodospiraceae bacterium]|nr:hypothetical protein [Ectothiorhodospiraceae bacterium]
MDTISKMRDIDRRYRSLTGLTERRFYSIFYSRIDAAAALVLGINPGGDPATWNEDELASRSFYENGEHEYVDCAYAIQQPMLPLLMQVFGVNRDGVRKIPKSNLAFRRSNGVDAFKVSHGMTLTQGQREAYPFVEEIITYVRPRIIILEGITALDAFRRLYCEPGHVGELGEPLYTDHRGRRVRIFCGQLLPVRCLAHSLPVLAIGHPSHFGGKPEFPLVVQRAAEIVAKIEVDARQPV